MYSAIQTRTWSIMIRRRATITTSEATCSTSNLTTTTIKNKRTNVRASSKTTHWLPRSLVHLTKIRTSSVQRQPPLALFRPQRHAPRRVLQKDSRTPSIAQSSKAVERNKPTKDRRTPSKVASSGMQSPKIKVENGSVALIPALPTCSAARQKITSRAQPTQ